VGNAFRHNGSYRGGGKIQGCRGIEHLRCTCSFARRDAAAVALVPIAEGVEHLIEEVRRQKAVVVAVAVRQLRKSYPGQRNSLPSATTIQDGLSSSPRCRFTGNGISTAEAGFHGGAVRDRQYRHDGRAGGFALNGEDDDARPVFCASSRSGLMLMMPKIGIGDDKAWLRVGDQHGASLFWIE
jgi:hypothetical protein